MKFVALFNIVLFALGCQSIDRHESRKLTAIVSFDHECPVQNIQVQDVVINDVCNHAVVLACGKTYKYRDIGDRHTFVWIEIK